MMRRGILRWEYALYFCQNQNFDYMELSVPLEENPAVKRFREIAKELSVVLSSSLMRPEGSWRKPIAIGCPYPVVIERGEGAMIEDVDGNRFLDWVGGVGVLNIVYSQPEVVEAVEEQADKSRHCGLV